MGEYLTVIFIITLYLAELSGKVLILCLHALERARQYRLIKFRAIDFRFDDLSEVAIFYLLLSSPHSWHSLQRSLKHSFLLPSNIPCIR